MGGRHALVSLALVLVFCLTPTWTLSAAEVQALSDLAFYLPDLRFIEPTPWIPENASSACSPEWTGLTCFAGSVVQISLPFQYLDGALPPSILGLTSLRSLDLSRNLIVDIPDEIGTLKQLQRLDLSFNLLESLPDSLGQLQGLRFMDLSSNKLNGSVPDSLGALLQLTQLNLARNHLTDIPDSLGNLTNLQSLDLSNNLIAGTIPSTLGNLRSLTRLDLQNNKFFGLLPPSLGQLRLLRFFSVSSNDLDGSIPVEFLNMTSLASLYCDSNYFGGEFPTVVVQMPSLRYLDLSNNLFSGILPDAIGNFTLLKSLHLEFNNFSGPIPPAIGQMTQLEQLYLHHNQITGNIPPTISSMASLQFLQLQANLLSGEAPNVTLAQLPSLRVLFINNNNFTGCFEKPPRIGSNTVFCDASGNALCGCSASVCGIPHCYVEPPMLPPVNPPVMPPESGLCVGRRPTPDTLCSNGTWVVNSTLVVKGTTLPVEQPTFIAGNFTVLGDGTIYIEVAHEFNDSVPLTVDGCITLGGILRVFVDPKIVLPKRAKLPLITWTAGYCNDTWTSFGALNIQPGCLVTSNPLLTFEEPTLYLLFDVKSQCQAQALILGFSQTTVIGFAVGGSAAIILLIIGVVCCVRCCRRKMALSYEPDSDPENNNYVVNAEL